MTQRCVVVLWWFCGVAAIAGLLAVWLKLGAPPPCPAFSCSVPRGWTFQACRWVGSAYGLFRWVRAAHKYKKVLAHLVCLRYQERRARREATADEGGCVAGDIGVLWASLAGDAALQSWHDWHQPSFPMRMLKHYFVARAAMYFKHRWGVTSSAAARGVLLSKFRGLLTRAPARRRHTILA